MSQRAAIYARVSSDRQRDAQTIQSQLHVLRAFVERSKWKLVETYTDDGRSAKTGMLDRRDGFARLMADAEAHRFDVLVVLDVNRLTRTGSIEERAEILGPFQRLGVSIATPSGGVLDLRSFLGEFWVTVQALVAAEENRKRANAIMAGKVRAIAEGRKPAGPTPYGWTYTRATGEWSLDKPAAAIVREVFRRIAKGESCVMIADDLIARDAKPAPRTGWTRAAVYRIVRKRTAAGEWVADKRQRITLPIPAIVTEEQWQAASDALLAHKRRGLVRTKHVYLLEGLGVCQLCGSRIDIRSATRNTLRTNGNPSPAAYVCRARKLDGAYRGDPSAPRCKAPVITTAQADDRVWALCEAVLAGGDLVRMIQNRFDAREANRSNWEADAKGYRQRLDRLDRATAAAMAQFRRGTVTEAQYDRELAEIAKDRSKLESQLKAAKAGAARSGSQESAELVAARLRALAENVAPEARHRVVRTIVEQAVFKANGKIQVFFAVDDPATSGVVLVKQAG